MGQVPGSPAVSEVPALPQDIVDASNDLTDAVFGTTPSELSFFSLIIEVIFGGGSVVTNFFAIDPNTGLIVVAATAADEADGTMDGLSEFGAIYSFELAEDTGGGLGFRMLNAAEFMGGTGSTPSISEDGSRIYVSDNVGNVIAFDTELEELWRFDVGDPLAASVAVSPDNAELFAVTRTNIFKLTDLGDSARLDWTAQLDAFADDPDIEIEFNALTPTITANGVAISVGGGYAIGTTAIMLKVGVGLLDRDTGALRSFTEGREESIAVTSVGPQGGIYTASSPVRRVSGKALNPDDPNVADVIGGISRYKPVRNDLLVRDASCAAGVRARNAASIADSAPNSAMQDIRQIQVLIDAVEEMEAATGIDFQFGGVTSAGMNIDDPIIQPERAFPFPSLPFKYLPPDDNGADSVDLMIGFSNATDTGDLNGGVIGVGGSLRTTEDVDGFAQQFRGFAVIDLKDLYVGGPSSAITLSRIKATTTHELGHLMGLGHVDTSTAGAGLNTTFDDSLNSAERSAVIQDQLMFPALNPANEPDFDDGDLQGLFELYGNRSCAGAGSPSNQFNVGIDWTDVTIVKSHDDF